MAQLLWRRAGKRAGAETGMVPPPPAAALNARRAVPPAHAPLIAAGLGSGPGSYRWHDMTVVSSLTGERSDSKVAAVFDSEGRAHEVARQAREALGLQESQVQVVTPQ